MAEGRSRTVDDAAERDVVRQPGACADPSCPVLHADMTNPIHPPDYEPGGPLWDTTEEADRA